MGKLNSWDTLYYWDEYGDEDNEIIKIASKQDILNFYYEFWKEKMIRLNKEHLISEENCIEDFCVIHYAKCLKSD